MAVAITYAASVIASCAVPMSVNASAAVRTRAVQAPITGQGQGTRMPIFGFWAQSADVGAVRSARNVKLAHRATSNLPSTTKQPATIGVLVDATRDRTWRPPD